MSTESDSLLILPVAILDLCWFYSIPKYSLLENRTLLQCKIKAIEGGGRLLKGGVLGAY